jgi:uncharacterized protein YqjF (DUF2071 family)
VPRANDHDSDEIDYTRAMDRLAPTHRPSRAVAGQQKWRDLLFLHWPVSERELRPLVPQTLDIDTFEGTAYIGIVPFAMFDVRPWYLPKALAFNFLETNVRTYVHQGGRDPGVYFFSLEAASWLAVKAARLSFSLPYFHARMSLDKGPDSAVEYRSERAGAQAHIHTRYRVGAELGASRPDTLEHFLFERYLLHVMRRGALHTGQVHHSPYPVFQAALESCDETLIHAAGLPPPGSPPALSHYSPGVDVEIFALERQASPERS